jgi:hypothetical protein
VTRPAFLAPDALDVTGCGHDWWPLHPNTKPQRHAGVVWSCRMCGALAGTEVAMRSPITAARWTS